MRNYERVIALANDSNGIITTKQAVDTGIPKDYLKSALDGGILERVAAGVYVLYGTAVDDYYLIQLKRTKAIFSHATAAYLNGLTTRDPLVLSLTVPKTYNAHELSKAGHKIYYCREENYGLGIITTKTMFGNTIKLYNSERTLCDLFSARYQGDPYIALESLKAYLTSGQKDIHKLMKYAKQLGVEKALREKIEVMSI